MRTLTSLVLLASLATPTAALAEAFQKTTPQFGFFGVDVAPGFRLGAGCTVSAGGIQDVASDYLTLLPQIGNYVSYGARFFSLEKGEAACGLGQYESMGKFYNRTRSKGYDMEIRTYAAQNAIGGGSPSFFCKELPVNKTGVCYEVISLSDNGGKAAEGVSACIEINGDDGRPTKSLVVFAGTVPDPVAAQWVDGTGSLQDKPCKDRIY